MEEVHTNLKDHATRHARDIILFGQHGRTPPLLQLQVGFGASPTFVQDSIEVLDNFLSRVLVLTVA